MRRHLLVLAVASLTVGCGGAGGGRGGGGPVDEARALIDQGDYDGALARLGSGEDPESLYLFGRAWAGKAGPPSPGGALNPAEQRALDFLEQALAAQPDHAGAHLAVAELLAPHVPTPGPAGAPPSAPDVAPGQTVTADRVLAAYGAAVQADPADKQSAAALIRFAMRVQRPSEAEAGFQELVKRDRENPDVLVEFGDFLVGPGADPEAALGVYAQALMWRPDDAETHLKMADIHIAAARGHVERREFVAAERRLREARKNVVDPSSPQATELGRVEQDLADVSGRR